jgi:chorismate dehydratase
MSAPESAEDLARRLDQERRTANLVREVSLEQSLAPFRVGSVKALNTVPLTRGIEDQIVYATPAKLAEMLRLDELDAGLVSVVEPLLNDRYDILDGIAVASLGEVKSVLLAHRQPLEQMREVYCDTASLTSVRLLKVLLAERGLNPEFKPLPDYNFVTPPDNLMLIGDAALDFLFGQHEHRIYDLGAAWFEMTGLPFVYAVWALRRGVHNPDLRRQLRDAKDFGVETLDHIIGTRTEYTLDFRKDYFGWHLHYHLGSDERRGIARFMELLRNHGVGPLYEPKFVW